MRRFACRNFQITQMLIASFSFYWRFFDFQNTPVFAIFGEYWFWMRQFVENRLIEEFKGRESFTRDDLFDFYRQYEPDLKEGTFGWRIYELKDKNIIRSLKRGLYFLYTLKFSTKCYLGRWTEHLHITVANMRSKFYLWKFFISKFISYICCYKYVLFLFYRLKKILSKYIKGE